MRDQHRGARGLDRPSTADGGPVSYAIFALARVHRGYAAALLRELGLHPGQELLLMRLLDRDGQTQSELLDVVGLDHSTVSKSLSRMQHAGLVSRTRAPHDRRVLRVHLTDKGRDMRAPIEALWARLERLTVAALDPSRVDQFVETAEEILRTLSRRA
jgi:DNA-binding MarR family transcriptional regulator